MFRTFKVVDGEKHITGYIYKTIDLAKEDIKCKYQDNVAK